MSRAGAYYHNPGVVTSFPAGWQPPFQGPPPMPSGVNINPQLWNMGQWAFNPAYQHRQPPQVASQAAWMAGQNWSAYVAQQGQNAAAAAQAQGQSHNPYKRVIRPPSAEYLASKLVDNPLGLTNMVPREELYKGGDGAQHTPWVWNPRGLVEDDDSQGIINADFRDATGRRIAQESRGLAPSRQGSISRNHGFDPSLNSRPSSAAAVRHPTDPAASGSMQQHHESPMRHRSEPPPQIYASASRDHERTPPRRGSSQERPPSHTDRARDEHQRRNSDASVSAQSLARSQTMESFTSQKELKPTFPSSIIRTPDHYHHLPSRSNSAPVYANNATATGTAEAAQLAARIERMTLGSSGRPGAELSRHASLPTSAFNTSHSSLHTSSSSSSLSDVHHLSEEPSAMLSPLMLGTTPRPSSRALGRGHSTSSIPGGSGSSSLSSIPETSSPLNPNHHAHTNGRSSTSNSTNHSPNHQPPSRQSSRSRGPSPAVTPPQRSPSDPHFAPAAYSSASSPSHHTPPYSAPSHRSPSRHTYVSPTHSQNTSPNQSGGQSQIYGPPASQSQYPPQSHSRLSNPLPAPPVEIRMPLANPSRPKTPPANYTRRVRKGFWNRRGDHLSPRGSIVYAPERSAYPEELRDYPHEREGYRDELGAFAEFNPNRPELPESLPWHGKPPERPYESFIEYEYQ